MRFDYAHDAVPEAIERLRPSRVPRELQTPLAALLTVTFVVLAAWPIEFVHVRSTETEVHSAEEHVRRTRAELARYKLARVRVEALFGLDAQLRSIRTSGATISVHLADIANHVPPKAWLTSVSHTRTGTSVAGNAEDLSALSETVADLMSSATMPAPALVRAGKTNGAFSKATLSFEMRSQEASK
jgi:Tfp pilus assembly protein PilN